MEEGPLLELCRALARKREDAGAAYVRCFEDATELSVPDFEADFKAWLLGRPASIVARAAQAGPSGRSPGEGAGFEKAAKAARALEKIRASFFSHDLYSGQYKVDPLAPKAAVFVSRDLCARATSLAQVLAKKKLKDLSTEARAELDALRPHGAWRPGLGLVDTAATSPGRSLERWLGSYYHRCLLLDPGLLSIGWGTKGDVAACDATSLVDQAQGFWGLSWRVDKARAVPIRHTDFRPSPYPGKRARSLGYPITLHLGPDVQFGKDFVVELELRKGSTKGELVECWVSSPSAPTHPVHAPRNVWCLLPKRPLARGTSYFVKARVRSQEEKTLRWSFRTRG